MIYEKEFAALDDLELTGNWRGAVDSLAGGALDDGELSPVVRELGLAMVFAGRGQTAEARRHGQRAVDAGVTRPQVIEALITGTLHGGFGIFWDNQWIASAAVPAPWVGKERSADANPESVRDYFTEVWGGSLPPWITLLEETSPDLLRAYFVVRTDALGDGALPRKDKELLLTIMNCVEHYDFGTDVHMRGALQAGATRGELLGAMRAALIAGGMVAWVAAADIATRALSDAGL